MHFEIIVGSVLGASEYVADALEEYLNQHGHSSHVHLQPALAEIDSDKPWLVITSTHGAGDLPDNIQSFADDLAHVSLHNAFVIIGLGDTSYDTFCQGAITLQEKLEKAGSRLLAKPLHIDVLHHPVPEEFALEWFEQTLGML